MRNLIAIGIGILFFTGLAFANELVVFPAKGQSDEQMEKDKYDCYQWAKNQSGFDPMAPPTTQTAPPEQQAQLRAVLPAV